MSIPLARSRYNSRFIVSDIQNNRKYLADQRFGWGINKFPDDLSIWSLAGILPTVAVNGKLDIYMSGGGGLSSQAYRALNLLGANWIVISVKVTKMADDTSTSPYGAWIALSNAHGSDTELLWMSNNPPGTQRFIFRNDAYLGNLLVTSQPTQPLGTEQQVDMIVSPSNIMILINGQLASSIPTGKLGTAPLSRSPLKDWFASPKILTIECDRAGVGEVSHYQFTDIKVGTLAGVSP